MCDVLEYPDSMKYPVRENSNEGDIMIGMVYQELEDGSIELWFVFKDQMTDEFYRVLKKEDAFFRNESKMA